MQEPVDDISNSLQKLEKAFGEWDKETEIFIDVGPPLDMKFFFISGQIAFLKIE